jgi:hypothetical protein
VAQQLLIESTTCMYDVLTNWTITERRSWSGVSTCHLVGSSPHSTAVVSERRALSTVGGECAVCEPWVQWACERCVSRG